jgi:tRNA(Ile)-lysidine synthase
MQEKIVPAKNTSTTEQKVLSFIRDKNLAGAGDKAVLAVSGGADSVCLAHIMSGLQKELGIELHIAHLNHRLRGAASDADAEYVTGLAKRLGIPATVASRDVKRYQKQHRLSLEEAAREVRYGFLAEVASEVGAKTIMTGHTSDDNIETILMHLIRGSGTRGMRGLMPFRRWSSGDKELTVIRPLLELRRKDTVVYCRRHRLKPRTDTSNFSTEPFRNKIRLNLLPDLKKYNPKIGEALLRTARIAADDLDYIETAASQVQEGVIDIKPGQVIIRKKEFLSFPAALQRQLLRTSVAAILGSLKDVEAGHIEEIIKSLDKSAGKVIGLPFGLNFTIEYYRYILAPDATELCPFPVPEKEFSLKIPGKTKYSGWEIEASITEKLTGYDKETDGFTACFDYDRTGNRISVRSRLPGDRFQPLGMEQPKKLNVFMIDARIPQAWRSRVPIVCSEKQVIWVAGWRIDERARVRPDTGRVLRLTFKRI